MLSRTMIFVAHLLWLITCLPSYLLFWFKSGNPDRTQKKVLHNILRTNRSSWFGQKFEFTRVKSVDDFQRVVPLSEYKDYTELIERIGNGEPGVLTTQPILFLQPSSGSTSASKFLPFTTALRCQFQMAIRAWIFNLLYSRPNLMAGKSYWSITPIQTTEPDRGWRGVLPVNFDDDLNYLGLIDKLVLKTTSVLPANVGRTVTIRNFKYLTLFFLLREKNIRLISVWSPTFLLLLFEDIESSIQSLIRDIETGIPTLPDESPDPYVEQPRNSIDPQRHRAIELRMIWLEKESTIPDKIAETWPHLTLISAWADAGAALSISSIATLFSNVEIQAKGLIATEAFVSFPIFSRCKNQAGSALALRSHFFEFLPYGRNEEQKPCLASELEIGRKYEVVVTTGAGLYRYRLNDIVEVVGFFRKTPRLRFCGKSDHVIDIVGEKLNAYHVGNILNRLEQLYGYQSKFSLLAPERCGEIFLYTLFLSSDKSFSDPLSLSRDLDQLLQDNYHYRYCRSIGQLASPRIFLIDETTHSPDAIYLQRCAQDTRLGDIKPACVDSRFDWSSHFNGSYAIRDDMQK